MVSQCAQCGAKFPGARAHFQHLESAHGQATAAGKIAALRGLRDLLIQGDLQPWLKGASSPGESPMTKSLTL